ncbi:uncharacterized protein LOC125943023 [Dermacentor silvarum]|uniref:uncharacterized protein LOC125943023 n=1 Tax=Dermacentor silvarum TaxID=543639 RepID=UPI00210128AA|nr:uncharacterized protein LOC125943023 [Dermacentor silvarum]
MLTYLVACLLIPAVSSMRGECKVDLITTEFDHNPDAWKLIGKTHKDYYLMFVSKKTVDLKKCVRTVRSINVPTKKFNRQLTYSYWDGTELHTENITLGIKKTSQCYVYENEVTATKGKGGKREKWYSEVIYSDYSTCLLMQSRTLGYNVWTAVDYMKQHNETPYLCVLLYEIFAGTEKHWVYDSDLCTQHQVKIP